MNKLAVFDFDSTLLDGECIDIVLDHIMQSAEEKRYLQRLRQIHQQGLRGELTLQESLEQRIAYFKGLSLSELESICHDMPWMPNAKKTITALKQQGYLTLCLSGAFRTATQRVINDLGVDAYCCNTLENDKGVLTGRISGTLMQHQSKGEILRMVQQDLGITPQNTIVVGDGANDLSMFAHAAKKIAFCAKAMVVAKANCVVETKDLSEIMRFIDI